jgi:hypothetical protein
VIEKIGGASRDRTDDLIVANDALSQLSYSPVRMFGVPDYFISLPPKPPTSEPLQTSAVKGLKQIILTNRTPKRLTTLGMSTDWGAVNRVCATQSDN